MVIVCGAVGMRHLCDASTSAGIVEVRQGPSAEMWGGTWLDSLQVERGGRRSRAATHRRLWWLDASRGFVAGADRGDHEWTVHG